VYYACRAISTQEVKDMAYEDLNPVNISFMLTDHNEKKAVRRVKLCDTDTFEVYDDLIEITLVHIPVIIRNTDKKSNLYLFARFFAISGQDDANKFVNEFETTELGKELIVIYNNAVANASNLQRIENSPYFIARLTEAQLEEERKKALLKAARKLLSEGITPEIIAKCLDLDINIIRSLKPVI